MTWHVAAHGETDEDGERELHDLLAQVLSDPKFGTAASQLATRKHNGPVHQPKKTPKK